LGEPQVLFITGYAENAATGKGHLEPGMHILTKPFENAIRKNQGNYRRELSRLRELLSAPPRRLAGGR
jgi:hypothetical protein